MVDDKVCSVIDFYLSEGSREGIYFILNNLEVSLDKSKFGVVHASVHEYDPKLKLIKRIY